MQRSQLLILITARNIHRLTLTVEKKKKNNTFFQFALWYTEYKEFISFTSYATEKTLIFFVGVTY